MNCSPTGSSVHGILQAGDLPKPGIEPRSPALKVDSLMFEPPGKPTGRINPEQKRKKKIKCLPTKEKTEF